jgi:hypothetical protein
VEVGKAKPSIPLERKLASRSSDSKKSCHRDYIVSHASLRWFAKLSRFLAVVSSDSEHSALHAAPESPLAGNAEARIPEAEDANGSEKPTSTTVFGIRSA